MEMDRDERMHRESELTFLRQRLESLPENARIMRMSTQSRIRDLESRLERAPAMASSAPARVRLAFNGAPVIGSHGIYADFGVKALSAFNDAISAVAASLQAPLAPMGPIPARGEHQLLITRTVHGSFGFELEECPKEEGADGRLSGVARALENMERLLEGSLGSDDDLADSLAETDPRALDKIVGFLQLLSENQAVCTMQSKGRSIRFSDVGQLRTSLARLATDNRHEETVVLNGTLLGVLPCSRTFEFRSVDNELIKGRISQTIDEPESLNSFLGKELVVHMLKATVGEARPRYQLVREPEEAESAKG